MKTIRGTFFIPIYDTYVNIVISNNVQASINRRMKINQEEESEYESGDPGAYCYQHKSDEPIYLFFHHEHITHTLINHEKSHAIDLLLKTCGVKKGDESRAYLDGFISGKLHKFFNLREIKIR